MILNFSTHFPDKRPTHFRAKIISYVTNPNGGQWKIHTIRKGARWRAGMSIQMCTGARTKNYHQFNKLAPELQTCISVQYIGINPAEKTICVDGKMLNEVDIYNLARNDGFDSLDDFWSWFKADFYGQIVHWTDKRY